MSILLESVFIQMGIMSYEDQYFDTLKKVIVIIKMKTASMNL